MNSFSSTRERIGFRVLQTRLVRQITVHLQNGDFSERGLARMLGISQPQMHNVLKGVRKLTPELADRLLAHFDISVFDLFRDTELAEASTARQQSPDVAIAAAHAYLATMREGRTPRKPLSRERSDRENSLDGEQIG